MKSFLCIAAAALLCGCATEPAREARPTPPPIDIGVIVRGESDWETERAAIARGRKSYVAEHSDLKPQVREAILNAQIMIGMSKAEVEASWGKPLRSTHSEFATGNSDSWTYDNMFLLFYNGVLSSWTESK